MEQAAVSTRPVERAWRELHCRDCGRLLLKYTDDPVRQGGMIEIVCRACKALNYLMGRVNS